MPPTLRSRKSNGSGSTPTNNTAAVRTRRRQGGFVPVPASTSDEGALKQVEGLLESIVDSLTNGVALVIPYRTRTPRNVQDISQRSGPTQTQCQALMFPSRSDQELKKFEALFRLLELIHEALLSGNILTKRNIYYQNLDLFTSQVMVDEMIDNLAYTLGVGRDDLNIVAAAKGLLAGPIELKTRDNVIIQCSGANDSGILLPSINSVAAVNFQSVKWLLVIEKEATLRTLVAAEYHLKSKAGQGILVTAKGFPDLATRRFLHVLQAIRPTMPFYGLVDFDPYGISIFRTFKIGSRRLDHEDAATVPALQWLGIRSEDVQSYMHSETAQSLTPPSSQSSESQASQASTAYSFDGLDDAIELPPRKRVKTQQPQDRSGSIVPLTSSDRKRAVNLMKEIESLLTAGATHDVKTAKAQLEQVQKMLMLNIKAEIQAVDNFGDITDWLDRKLCLQAAM
ncbi:Spo11/DNA topoisomerase VI subunit A [Rhypophila decipiens]|uniref:DNA topoisomerase (ATP-hydrolyzing) n=1 Tax=Rhypophila decipiens TaxID=261697 RepID=A0AAN6Y7D9_9PEZI|nr:Spo11/DNA topoisomerase VI subunit A [Rhypophila decipiens]